MRVMVVSYCNLTLLSFETIIKEVIMVHNEAMNVNVEQYHSIDDERIYNESNERSIVILDVDDINPSKVFNTISQIRASNPLSFVMVFCRKLAGTEDFTYLSILSDGILCKTASVKNIKSMIVRAFNSRKTPKNFNRLDLKNKIKSQLTERENEVFECILIGLRNPDISIRLNMKSKTASAHRRNIYNKLGVRTVNEILRTLLTSQ
ncbi:LuxR family transcriptional regulatory protein [Yersinia frederiksenii]|jgi:DNA-binding NarL/FixJ family response regulator|uniref:Helix-turn-helix transcriptional regulator n=3 Tax=Yersiniaceae TaxID=1903411 RepID=A0A2R4NPS7_9GAMM|nr:helix-turn-helix transcriptional regulator [Yersinia frederiksenii]AVX38123.1 helix-turn-helix transcriptional regulator [Yersinia massiliensis]HEC1651563.1 helix-turn-helix transcriptional regulator [Yersinia enterocolitica]NIL25949.1 helix-turn-helix transcriptional regulator [Yersinia massiliensis]OWF73891.1 helix-turn-helix transcriptional regulator [Yersinia frederiksenii]